MNNEVIIGRMADGWEVVMPNGHRYWWTHNDDDLGTEAIKEMLQDIGWNVTIEDWY